MSVNLSVNADKPAAATVLYKGGPPTLEKISAVPTSSRPPAKEAAVLSKMSQARDTCFVCDKTGEDLYQCRKCNRSFCLSHMRNHNCPDEL